MDVQPLGLLEAQAALECVTPVFSSEAILLPFDVLQRHTVTFGVGHRMGRRGPRRGRESPWLCLPIHLGQIQFYHFTPGWSGIQQAVGCLSTEPESQVSQGSGASGWVLWL